MDGKWRYDNEFCLFESAEPIFVASVQGKHDVWFTVAGQYPSAKQIAAWVEFCNLSSDDLREQLILELIYFKNQLSNFLKNSESECDLSYHPEIKKNLVQKAVLLLQKSVLPLGAMESSVFKCESFVIPLQENSQSHFVLMNFTLGAGEIPNQSYGYEMEALFCDGKLLFIEENSGLWTRPEWENEFNIQNFDPITVMHTY